MKKEIMSPERLAASLAIRDLTDPKNGIHAINIMVTEVKEGLKRAYPEVLIEEIRTSPEVSVRENFDDLLFPADNVGRSSRYTRHVSHDTVLRTHTSAAIPAWLRSTSKNKLNDTIVFLPGMCYRRDVVDKTHCAEPHQMDVWRIRHGEPRFNRSDLINLIETVLKNVAPGYEYRVSEVQHPYTINGLEVEVLVNGNWLEVLECGEAHPIILANAGLNPKEYSGLALGMGLDRLVMIIKEIDDIRVLRSEDPRIQKQMMNLKKFIAVSNQPQTKRVLSYSSSRDKNEEDICEIIRDELQSNATYVEQIQYEEISYDRLEAKAKENLGIRPNQKNIVVTLTFRSLEGSLPKKLVNEWVQKLYPKLNEGDRGYM